MLRKHIIPTGVALAGTFLAIAIFPNSLLDGWGMSDLWKGITTLGVALAIGCIAGKVTQTLLRK